MKGIGWILRIAAVGMVIWGVVTFALIIPVAETQPQKPVVWAMAALYSVLGFVLLAVDYFMVQLAKKAKELLKEQAFGELRANAVREAWVELMQEEIDERLKERQQWMDIISDERPVDREYIPVALRRFIEQRDGYTCSYCHEVGTTELDPDGRAWCIDHALPVSRGGRTIPANLTLACSSCNFTKNNKTPVEFMRYRQRQGR